MKQLTQQEFDALGDGPHNALEFGVPSEHTSILNWDSDASRWHIIHANMICDVYPIWHKLPDDYEGDG